MLSFLPCFLYAGKFLKRTAELPLPVLATYNEGHTTAYEIVLRLVTLGDCNLFYNPPVVVKDSPISTTDPTYGGGVPLDTGDGYPGGPPQDTLSFNGTAMQTFPATVETIVTTERRHLGEDASADGPPSEGLASLLCLTTHGRDEGASPPKPICRIPA